MRGRLRLAGLNIYSDGPSSFRFAIDSSERSSGPDIRIIESARSMLIADQGKLIGRKARKRISESSVIGALSEFLRAAL